MELGKHFKKYRNNSSSYEPNLSSLDKKLSIVHVLNFENFIKNHINLEFLNV